MIAVVVVTSVLVAQPPARDRGFLRPARCFVDSTGPFDLNLVVDPARTGNNSVHLYLLDHSTGQPAAVSEIDVSATLPVAGIGPLRFAVSPAGPGHAVIAAAAFPLVGRWQVERRCPQGRLQPVEGSQPSPWRQSQRTDNQIRRTASSSHFLRPPPLPRRHRNRVCSTSSRLPQHRSGGATAIFGCMVPHGCSGSATRPASIQIPAGVTEAKPTPEARLDDHDHQGQGDGVEGRHPRRGHPRDQLEGQPPGRLLRHLHRPARHAEHARKEGALPGRATLRQRRQPVDSGRQGGPAGARVPRSDGVTLGKPDVGKRLPSTRAHRLYPTACRAASLVLLVVLVVAPPPPHTAAVERSGFARRSPPQTDSFRRVGHRPRLRRPLQLRPRDRKHARHPRLSGRALPRVSPRASYRNHRSPATSLNDDRYGQAHLPAGRRQGGSEWKEASPGARPTTGTTIASTG